MVNIPLCLKGNCIEESSKTNAEFPRRMWTPNARNKTDPLAWHAG